MLRIILLLVPLMASLAMRGEAREQPGVWTAIAPGLAHRVVAPALGSARTPFRLEAFRVDLRLMKPLLLDARREGRKVAKIATLARETGARLAFNASFFDEHQRPLGLLVSADEELSPLRNADWGVLAIRSPGRASLVHTREWKPGGGGKGLELAVQVGPRLVVDGKPLGLKNQYARRLAVGILDPQHLVVVSSEGYPVESNDLARLMAAPVREGGLGCRFALMMDGGPSAQITVKTARFEHAYPGGSEVPIGIGFLPR